MVAKARESMLRAVFATAVLVIGGCENVGNHEDVRPLAEERQEIRRPSQPPGGTIASSSTQVAGLSPSVLQQYYACREGKGSCSRDPLVAQSPEEAQWLQIHGYPTPDQIRNSLSSSADSLRFAAERSRLPVDESLYGLSLVREGEYRGAVGSMAESFMRNENLYALYILSDVYMQSDELKNPSLAMAYLRLAYLAGDSKAGNAIEMRSPRISPPERASIDRRAAELKIKMAPDRSWQRP